MNPFKIEAQNEFSKTFDNGEIKLYIAKAVDEDSNKHFIVCSIPQIQEVDASSIQYPLEYQTAEERDANFQIFEENEAMQFVTELIDFIKLQKEKNQQQNEQQPEQAN